MLARGLTLALVAWMVPPPAGADEPGPPLARATPVVLDFRDRPLLDVARTIEARTGKRVTIGGLANRGFNGMEFLEMGQLRWRDQRITLEAPAPLPFWEAIDRLAVAAGGLSYRLGDWGETTGVVLERGGEAPGPSCRAGPFLVALRGVHAYREAILVRGPWVRFEPSGVAVPADAATLTAAPADGGPLYAELEITPEPGLVCRRDGPVVVEAAEDAAGRARAAPSREDERQRVAAFGIIGAGIAPVVRIPLSRPDGDAPGAGSLRILRGTIPVEIGVLRREPAVVIRLGGAEGRVVRGGGAEFTVRADRTQPDGRRSLAIDGRLIGDDDPPAVREARLSALRTFQVRVVDAGGQPARFASTSGGGDGRGTISLGYEYAPTPEAPAPPAEFRFYGLDRASWSIPFAFRDVPLP
jgi:hypothetical protein